MILELQLVDPEQNPYLSGRFAPVHREIESSRLTIEGEFPSDLLAPAVFDVDAMLAVWDAA